MDDIKELLMEAITGESLARNKYTFFAEVAKKEGYEEIAKTFQLTADNEKEHAKIWFKYLGLLGTTKENLLHAAEGEKYEFEDFYPSLEKRALELGDEKLANLFKKVGKIEASHAQKYRTLLKDVINDEVFTKKQHQTWICTNCGYEHGGLSAPEVCPVCNHPQAYFSVKKA